MSITAAQLNIKNVDFPESQYNKVEIPKTQIYLHHTAGNASAEGVFRDWATNPEKIATCVAISGPGAVDGQIVQGFDSKFWAFHLGLRESTFERFNVSYRSLDRISIGIEICNWGQLVKRGNKYYTYVNSQVPVNQVVELETPFKGYRYYHSYSDAQIESVRKLLLFWGERYGIPLKYNSGIFDLSKDALSGVPGVYTHNSVRTDKVDVYPHPKLIQMLKSL